MSLVVAIAALALVEGLCRLALGPDPMTSQSAIFAIDDEVGFRIAPNLNFDGFTTTSLGTRGAEPDFSKKERILVLGDSITIGADVRDEETFCHLLEKRLGAGAQVINAGCAGYCCIEEFSALRRLVPQVRPTRVLIIYYTGNDVGDAGRIERPYLVLAGRLVARTKYEETPPSMRMLNNLAAAFWSFGIPRAARRLKGAEPALVVNEKQGNFGMDNLEVKQLIELDNYELATAEGRNKVAIGWRRTSEVFKEIRDYCNEQKLPLTVAIMPLATVFDPGLRSRLSLLWKVPGRSIDAERPSRKVDELLRRLGIDTLDLTPAFRESPHQSKLHLPLDLHLSPLGHALVADVLARRVEVK
ncbi:MAG: GDSL-type esterase/lipase family protein [Planctomycetota bacterium]